MNGFSAFLRRSPEFTTAHQCLIPRGRRAGPRATSDRQRRPSFKYAKDKKFRRPWRRCRCCAASRSRPRRLMAGDRPDPILSSARPPIRRDHRAVDHHAAPAPGHFDAGAGRRLHQLRLSP
jgi:hypothetical protein